MTTLKTLATACATVLVAAFAAFAQPAPTPAPPTPPPPPPAYGSPITLEDAKKVMAAAEAEAVKNNWNAATW